MRGERSDRACSRPDRGVDEKLEVARLKALNPVALVVRDNDFDVHDPDVDRVGEEVGQGDVLACARARGQTQNGERDDEESQGCPLLGPVWRRYLGPTVPLADSMSPVSGS